MFNKITTAGLYGMDGKIVAVEAATSRGLPTFQIVGLAGTQIKESWLRVKTAMESYGLPYMTRRVTVNLAPANFPKEGTHYDLPIALSVSAALEGLDVSSCYDTAFFGELSLDGKLRRVRGLLPMVLLCQQSGIRRVVVPRGNLEELSLVEGMEVLPCASLDEVVEGIRDGFINSRKLTDSRSRNSYVVKDRSADLPDYRDVLGQESAKRAILISAAGAHGLLMQGSPGCGKSMLAERIVGILPPLTYEEQVETTKIFSVAGLLSDEMPFVVERPFRAPHHSITQPALLGGGTYPRLGELSLAHNGVLFLDELGEFSQQVVDGLREPLEKGTVTIARATGAVTFPSEVILVAASNPCPCGYYGDPVKKCNCSPAEIKRYQSRLSGPILDRIDMHIIVPRVPYKEMREKRIVSLDTQTMREMVWKGREKQLIRFAGTSIHSNAAIPPSELDHYCTMGDDARHILEMASEKWQMSARACHKIIRIARTIADVDDVPEIGVQQISEALQYRVTVEESV